MNYGGFWARFLAYLVDSVIVTLLVILIGGALAFLGEAGAVLIPAVFLGVPVVYWGLMHASARQATVGKALLGLKVTDSAGGRLTLGRALVREVCKYISALPLMIGFLLAAFTKRKQALHDFFVATTVLREGRSHTLIALVVGVFGWIAPAALATVVGVGIFAGMMGYMAGDMMAVMQEAQKQQQASMAMPPKPAAPAPKPAAPAPVAAANPAAPAPVPAATAPSTEVQTLLDARLSGIDKPGTTRAGPAILELDSALGGSFAIKTYLPMYKEFDGNGVSVQLTKVVDAKGADLYDPAHSLESAFFQRVSLRGESAPVPHLAGTRRVNLRTGADGKSVERAEGLVKLALPVRPTGVIFEGADLGKQQTVHGVGITMKATKGNAYTFEFKGDASRIVSTSGIGADGKRVSITASGGGGGVMTYTFAAPVARIEVVAAESLSQHSFPFTLTRTSLAGPAGPSPPVALKTAEKPVATMPAKAEAPKKPAPVPVAAKPKPRPKPAPVVIAQVEPKPAPQPMKEEAPAKAEPEMKPKPAPVRAAPPPPPPAPSKPGPKFNDLMTAVLYRDAAAVNELLAFGKWPDKPDSRGFTPLMAAAMIGERAIAEALVKAGANPERPGPGGETAVSIARERNDAAMLGVLESRGGR